MQSHTGGTGCQEKTMSIISITSLDTADHPLVHELFGRAYQHHLHLDWYTLDQLLNRDNLHCRMIKSGNQVRSLLGATVHSVADWQDQRVAWLRLMTLTASREAKNDLDQLWGSLASDLREMNVRQVALLMVTRRSESFLHRWGFARTNAVITLRRIKGDIPRSPTAGFSLRDAGQADLEAVYRVDTAAFPPLWQYDRAVLKAVFTQATSMTLLEKDGQVLGYQASTRYSSSAHLARLAVIPEAQGMGLGSTLVRDMLRFFASRKVTTVTVNTQEDNIRSQQLYARFGFEPINHSVPVWTLEL